MHAAIDTVKAAGAETIVVAIPVASPDSLGEIVAEVDAVVCLEAPIFFKRWASFTTTSSLSKTRK